MNREVEIASVNEKNAKNKVRMILNEKGYKPETALRIVSFLADSNYQFRIIIDEFNIVYFYIEHEIKADRLYIRHRPGRGITSVGMVMDFEPKVIEQYKERFLYACNFNNLNTLYVRSILLDDCIYFYYRVDNGERVDFILNEVMYDMLVTADVDIFNCVLDTSQDLRTYCENKEKMFHEQVKAKIDNYKT